MPSQATVLGYLSVLIFVLSLACIDENFFPSKMHESEQKKPEQARFFNACFPFIFQVTEINISFFEGAVFLIRMMYIMTGKNFLSLNSSLLLNVF